jgi:hypothetical protein
LPAPQPPSLRFEDALDVRVSDNGHTFTVIEPFHYETSVMLTGWGRHYGGTISSLSLTHSCTRIEVPVGFQTDFASIPRLLWAFLPPIGRYGRAAVIHDLLYRTIGLATRQEADAVLWEAMTFLRIGWITRTAIYAGVRLGGHWSYWGGF